MYLITMYLNTAQLCSLLSFYFCDVCYWTAPFVEMTFQTYYVKCIKTCRFNAHDIFTVYYYAINTDIERSFPDINKLFKKKQ